MLATKVLDFKANDSEGNILEWTAEPWRPKDDCQSCDDTTYARIRDKNGNVVFEIELSSLANLHDALFIADQAEGSFKIGGKKELKTKNELLKAEALIETEKEGSK